ncbi:MAG: Do family serine endopeptidase [Pseudomonadota bacterium]
MRALRYILISAMLAAGAHAQVSLSDQVDDAAVAPRPDSFTSLSKRLMPAVVNITTSQTIAPEGLPEFPDGSPLERFNEFFGRDPEGFRREGSLGSGFVISPEGLIVTNNHVIEGADEIDAVFQNGDVLRAELIGTDAATDLAVLRVTQAEPFEFVDWADSDSAEVGDWVMAIGNPFGFGGSVSVGIVSARNRDIQSGNYDDYIQTDAAINRGNSGGPLFNLDGEVLGVNTAIISPTGGSIGLGFSIPANLAERVSEQLVEFGRARRGWFGVNIQDADADLAAAYGDASADGVIITQIDEDGPAASSDFEIGDFILRFDDKAVENVRALSRIVAETDIGKTVNVDLIRDGRARTVSFTLGELDPEGETVETNDPDLPEDVLTQNPMGIAFAELNDDARRRYSVPGDVQGVLIDSVGPRGPSFGKLQKGDVILELGFEKVDSVSNAMAALDSATRSGEPLLLVRVMREGQTMFFPIELDLEVAR